MNDPATVGVAGLGLWLPGYPSVAAWSTGSHDTEAKAPLGRALDRINRRRAGVLGRALADAAAEAVADAAVDPSSVPILIGSAIGEASTMIGLLDQMWRHRTPMSPAAFTMSVHNAASGLISISNKNRGFTTSLAADYDTPAAALTEAVGLVVTVDQPVLVACGDEAAPADLVPAGESWDLLAAAVVLVPLTHTGARARLRIELPGAEPSIAPAALSPTAARNPQAGLVDLLDAVQRGATGRLRLDRGEGRGFLAVIEA